MTHSQERYGQTCSRNEFLTHIACTMEIAGELHENLSDRMDELIDPRAGSVHLNSFRVSISVLLPDLRCFLPHRGWDGGRA